MTVRSPLLRYFYPRSPRGERLYAGLQHAGSLQISIHAPREGSDLYITCKTNGGAQFLSTLPARGATIHPPLPSCWNTISIHAPREGSDAIYQNPRNHVQHFYPRSPRGERQAAFCSTWPHGIFLSTLPARGATRPRLRQDQSLQISIHVPRKGSDLFHHGDGALFVVISIHAPREGSDPPNDAGFVEITEFLSTLPVRGATVAGAVRGAAVQFLSTLPVRGATAAEAVRASLVRKFLSTLPVRGATL